MWTKIKWGIRIVLLLIVGLFLHYTMPQRDVVQIINTYNKLMPIGSNWMFYAIEDSGTGSETTSTQRDIRFIDAVFPDGKTVMVYRNEDTGWLWPPYFKWDSSTLQAEATAAGITDDADLTARAAALRKKAADLSSEAPACADPAATNC